MTSVLFSIIVPVYNAEKYLRECLDSVLAQTAADWECICIDDGSTDASGTILDEYAARDARFVVIHQPNAGVSAARNRGMDAAKGEYLLFVDGDDACVPWMLERLSDATREEPNSDFIMFNAQHVADMTVPLPQDVSRPMETIRIDSDTRARQAYERVNGVLLAWGGCHKATSVRSIRFQPYPNGEDALFGYACLCHAEQVSFLSERLYRYRLPRKGSANGMTLRNLRSCCEIGKEYRVVAERWRYRHILHAAGRAKRRSALYGIRYEIVLNVPANERTEAWGILRSDLKVRLKNGACEFSMWDRMVAWAAVNFGGRWLFHVLGYWPFRMRVRLLKIPGVSSVKRFVRRGRWA